MRPIRLIAGLSLVAFLLTATAQAQRPAWTWYEVDTNRNVRINLYLFWSRTCPRCPGALQFTDWLRQRHPWLNVHAYEISDNPASWQLYQQMATSLNRTGGQTPAFFYCKQMEVGYTSYEQTGRRIENSLVNWYLGLRDYYRQRAALVDPALVGLIALAPADSQAAAAVGDVSPPLPDLPVELPPEEEKIFVPGWGEVEANNLSLPTLTLVIAGCDAFNPCAFFVLLLLLSLLVHSQSRLRMVLVGGVFVFFSGLLYFLFMAAWLNLFFVIGHWWLFTAVAGSVAVAVGLLNVKDFFWLDRGPSLSLPDSARPGLFQRMTGLINASSFPSLLVGAAALAVVANLYELLCTSGFPMVYTRILTLHQLPVTGYYAYLALYNLIYVAPMALIVLGFTLTLGRRKLTEYQGRILKLLSGTMMLALGLILLWWPALLSTLVGAVGLLLLAVGVTGLVVAVERWRQHRPSARTEHHSTQLVGHAAEGE